MSSDRPLANERLAATFAAAPLTPRAAFARLRELGVRGVQLDAARPGLRPRELDRSARRDLAATIARHGMTLAGFDLWIPPAHFLDSARVDRAVAAVEAALDLAADLGRPPVSVRLPPADATGGPPGDTLAALAERLGVDLVDHAVTDEATGARTAIAAGIDPPVWLAQGADPIAAVSRLAARCRVARLCDLLTSGGRGPLGNADEGQLDVLAYRIALDTAGYAGPLVIDTRGWAHPWADLITCRAAWLDAAPDAAV